MIKKLLALAAVIGVLALAALSSSVLAYEPGTGPDGTFEGKDASSIDVVSTETGLISLSVDGLGTNDSSGIIQVEKPAGATVRKAFLAAASCFSRDIADGDVQINGIPISWDLDIWNNAGAEPQFFNNVFADVTALLKPLIDAAPAGRIDFTVTETFTPNINGEVLAVIFDDPSQIRENTVILLFGGQSTMGDMFNISLAETLDLSDPNSRVDFSLGISHGWQGLSQYSIVDVNGIRMTSSAGGQDDGYADNGALLTAGGLDDSNANPPDPYAGPNGDPRMDDELYDLKPFVNTGDRIITLNTLNPSDDDDIFFASLFLTVRAFVGEGITLAPLSDTNSVGQLHTITATVVDDSANPVVDREVGFSVVWGPHAGQTGKDTTDNNGEATFAYTGQATGTDTIEASFVNSQGQTQYSNRVAKLWTEAIGETITLAPLSDTNLVGQLHTVTATAVDDSADPVVDREVVFTVVWGPHAGETGKDTTDNNGEATFAYVGTSVGTDTIEASFVNSQGQTQYSNRVVKLWTEVVGETISLAPVSDTNFVGLPHTVTVTVVDDSANPVVDREVIFSVFWGPHAGQTGKDTTDNNGEATFTYVGSFVGTDSIEASFVNNQGQTQYSNRVAKLWVEVLGEEITLAPLLDSNFVGQVHTVTATVVDDSANPVVDREVSFTVVWGPHAGQTGKDTTNNNGEATFAYVGVFAGPDTIQASFMNSQGQTQYSNPVAKVWVRRPGPHPPKDTCVYPGKVACIPIYLDSLPPWAVFSAQMVLLYDDTVIQASYAKTESTIAEHWGPPTYNIGTGRIAIAMAGTDSLDTTGVLVWVCFDVVGEVGDLTLLTFQDDQVILNDSTFDAEPGIVRVCPEEYGICGRVRYCLNDEPIDSAKMMLSGGKDDTVYTNAFGMYKFLNLPAGLDYLVRGDKADDDRGAISAFDASLVLRYVVRLLDLSGCQMIAGDVTGNCWVNAYDASFILKYVVGLIPQFPIGKDWKFIPADFALDTLNWCVAPDSIFYDSLSEDKCCEDWMGILYGDLTGNWDNLLLVGRDSQQDVLSRLIVKELLVNPGEEFVVPVQVENISDVYAVELNLSYDNSLLSLVDVKAGDLLEGYYYEKNLTSGEIRLAMAGAHSIYGSGALAYLTFKVLPQAQEGISTQLEIKRICLNEASAGGFAYSIGIGSGATTRPLEFGLFQNYPNPFNPETEIGFSVPAACQVELKIYNIAGQLVKVYQGDYAAGAHSISWDGTNMRGEDVGSGIYFYRMEAGNFVQQKKMVLMR